MPRTSNSFEKLSKEGKIKLIRLEQDIDFKPFDCADKDLNDFLLFDSKIYLQHLSYTTFLFETEESTIAYFSLANDLLRIDDQEDFKEDTQDINFIDSTYHEWFNGQTSYPAVKIGRLAVDKNFQSQGIGTSIINLLKKSFTSNNKTGCQFITVDALNCPRTIQFYEKNKFTLLTLKDYNHDSRQMYLPLIGINNFK